MTHRSAVISECGTWRYELRRIWNTDKPTLVLCMLNPSTADASRDDPTVKFVWRHCLRWGYGGFIIVNLFAYRTKAPTELIAEALEAPGRAVGPENDRYIIRAFRETGGPVLCAWGANVLRSRLYDRMRDVLQTLRAFDVPLFRLTGSEGFAGTPRHPLYTGPDTEMEALPYAYQNRWLDEEEHAARIAHWKANPPDWGADLDDDVPF